MVYLTNSIAVFVLFLFRFNDEISKLIIPYWNDGVIEHFDKSVNVRFDITAIMLFFCFILSLAKKNKFTYFIITTALILSLGDVIDREFEITWFREFADNVLILTAFIMSYLIVNKSKLCQKE